MSRNAGFDRGIEIARRLQVTLATFVGIREHESRVPRSKRKFLQRAFDTDLPLDRFHLVVDARDLGEPELVDLVGRHRGRRHRREPLCVERGPVRQLPNARGDFVGVLEVGFDPRNQRVVRRFEVIDERGAHARAQRLGARRIDLAACGEAGDLRVRIGVERRLAVARKRRARNERPRRRDNRLVGEPRRMHAFAGRELRAREQLAHRTADAGDPRDVGDHVRVLVDAVKIDQRLRERRVRRAHLMKGVRATPERQRRLGPLEPIDPQVVRRARLRREIRAIELARQIAHRLPPPLDLRVLRAFGKLVDAVVVVLATELRLRQRAEVELLLVTRVEPRVQARALALVGGGRVDAKRRRRRLAVTADDQQSSE
jgi:hypothetical protein